MTPEQYAKIVDALLATHYGIGIVDTALSDLRFVVLCQEAKQTPYEAVNEIALECDLDRIDGPFRDCKVLLTARDEHAAASAVAC